MLSKDEKISCAFQAKDFVFRQGTKTGVMQRIMRIFVTKDKNKRLASNALVILSPLLNKKSPKVELIQIYLAEVDYRLWFKKEQYSTLINL